MNKQIYKKLAQNAKESEASNSTAYLKYKWQQYTNMVKDQQKHSDFIAKIFKQEWIRMQEWGTLWNRASSTYYRGETQH